MKVKAGQATVIGVMVILLVTAGLAAAVFAWGTTALSQGQTGYEQALTSNVQRVSEELILEDVDFTTGNIVLHVRNTGPVKATVNAVYVNGEMVSITPQSLEPGEAKSITLDYPWSLDETYEIALATGRGKTYAAYFKTPETAVGWLKGWQYRKSHKIEGSTVGKLTDYQVKIVAHYGVGTDSGENVYLNGHAETTSEI